MKKVHIITNPSSGKEEGVNSVAELKRHLSEKGYIVSTFETKKDRDALEEAKRVHEFGWDLVVAAGGDGTANEVVQGLSVLDDRIPFAVFPQGTVNDFATYTQMPADASAFADMVEKGKKIPLDIGKINEQFFLNVAAFGNISKIGHEVEVEKKTRMGRLAYLMEGVKSLPELLSNPLCVTLEVEGHKPLSEEFLLVAVCNTPSVGGFKNFAPKAVLNDGVMDVVGIKTTNLVALGQILLGVATGDHLSHPEVLYFRTKKLKVRSDVEVSIDIDGEEAGFLPAEIEVLHAHLETLIP